MSDSLQPRGLWPTKLLRPWDSPGNNTGGGCYFLLQGDIPNPGIEPRSPALQADALTSEPPGKPEIKIEGGKIELMPKIVNEILRLQ